MRLILKLLFIEDYNKWNYQDSTSPYYCEYIPMMLSIVNIISSWIIMPIYFIFVSFGVFVHLFNRIRAARAKRSLKVQNSNASTSTDNRI